MSFEKSEFYYKVYGLNVKSEIKIDEFVPTENSNYENAVSIKYSIMSEDIKESIKNNKKANFFKEEVWFYIDNGYL